MRTCRIVVVAGPTASGKSDLALSLARVSGGEIVNCDSVQLYRGFDIGSAKPPEELRSEVPHHLFDIAGPGEEVDAAHFARIARPVCEGICERGALPIVAGGTFFYLRALLAGLPEMPPRNEPVRERLRLIARSERGRVRLHRWLSSVDPASGSKISRNDRHRVERALEVWISSGAPISARAVSPGWSVPVTMIAIRIDRRELLLRIEARVRRMYDAGLVEETRELLSFYPRTSRAFGSIGYREALSVIDGSLAVEVGIAETIRRTAAYAKRQMTWLRSEQDVQWIDAADTETMTSAALRLIEGQS